MFARIQRFSLAQGMEEVAEDLAERVDAILRNHHGFDSLTLFSDETSGEYLFLTLWASLDDIAAFERSRDEWLARHLMSEHITTVPQIEVYQVHNLPSLPHAGDPDALAAPIEANVPSGATVR